ncbi:hypothetical protein ABPG72_021001 [Tetrahymena utriculariae]
MHQHILPMFLMPDMPMICVRNCGCRHPDRAHCFSCHKTSEKYKIKHKDDICCESETSLDYLFVIDFECTCDEEKRLKIQEIIEFPIVVIDLRKKEIIDRFHSFVRPTQYPILTPFCTKLTGITQEQVDSAPTLPEVLKEVDRFLEKYIKDGLQKVSVLNDCDSDIRNFLRKETTFKGIPVKPVFKEFIDLRRIFPVKISEKPTNIDHMLSCVGLTFEGIKHCGLDDATNIARVALEIAKRDYIYTEYLKEHMYPYDNPHYYEHLVIIATQPKMKNNVEIAMIAHDLRKGKTLWNNLGNKSVKKQEMKKELFEFLDKVGIDINNSILCVQGKLENEVRAFFQTPENQPMKNESNNTLFMSGNLTDSTSSTCSSSASSPSQQSLNTSTNCLTNSNITSLNNSASTSQQQSQTPYQSSSFNNFFTTYFSLNKISKIAGIPLAGNQFIQHPTYSQRYQRNRNIYQPYPFTMNSQYYPIDQQFMGGCNNPFSIQYAKNKQNFADLNQASNENLTKWWNGIKDATSPVTRITSMCNTVETALQNGFIFTKDFASTIQFKRALSKM